MDTGVGAEVPDVDSRAPTPEPSSTRASLPEASDPRATVSARYPARRASPGRAAGVCLV